MSNKIYVITAGDYSDYSIYGATTDPDRAEDMRKKVSAGSMGEAYIEEYEDGIFPELYDYIEEYKPVTYWRVTIRTNGTPPEAYSYTAKHKSLKSVCSKSAKGPWEIRKNGPPRREIYDIYMIDCIEAKDRDHAIKIATDEVAKFKARKEDIS